VKLFAAFVFSILAATKLQAAANGGFGLDAFNRAVNAATQGNAAFSPFSFEIDSVIFSEAVDALSRAKVAETMGVLNGLEYVYSPLHRELAKAGTTIFSFIEARGFCLLDERKALPSYRQWLQKTFASEIFSITCREGAECWFRTRLDGTMDSFSLPHNAASEGLYSYYDVVFALLPWKDPFPTNNTREIRFHITPDKSVSLQAMCDLRFCDLWQRKHFAALRMQLSENVFFFALLPNEGVEVRDIRAELSSSKIAEFLCGFQSVTDLGIFHEPIAVVIPKIDITTETNLKLPFDYFRIPTKKFERLPNNIAPKFIKQCVRVKIDERGVGDCYISEKPIETIIKSTPDTKRFVLNRPFLFLIYHIPTATIPIVGQFMGD